MSENSKTLFDTSLPRFAEAIRKMLGEDALKTGVFVRDNSGRLSFVAKKASPSEAERERLTLDLIKAIGGYARKDRAIAFRDDVGAERLLSESDYIPINIDDTLLKLVDRRIVGTAWLEPPNEEISLPPKIVFASLKGGVGRSTALAIAAADLARRNKNVLVMDLDLEAPGLGDLLLSEDRKPALGTVDYLVENGISGIGDDQLASYVGTSQLTTSEGGRVDVIPSLGKISTEHPENTLSKLSRAMIEDVKDSDGAISLTKQICEMVKRFSRREEYDVVLIDSRAGLSEITAPVILGLGAFVLLFGTAQKQTIEAYTALFATLQLLAQRDRIAGKDANWRLMLKAVHAKASLDPASIAYHRDELYELFAGFLYDKEESADPEIQALTFNIDDPSAPHWPLIVPFNPSFAEFDSAKHANQLTQPFYEQTFRQFMDGIDKIIESVK
jgi:cellulose biosynthesis protein BcsQ